MGTVNVAPRSSTFADLHRKRSLNGSGTVFQLPATTAPLSNCLGETALYATNYQMNIYVILILSFWSEASVRDPDGRRVDGLFGMQSVAVSRESVIPRPSRRLALHGSTESLRQADGTVFSSTTTETSGDPARVMFPLTPLDRNHGTPGTLVKRVETDERTARSWLSWIDRPGSSGSHGHSRDESPPCPTTVKFAVRTRGRGRRRAGASN